MNWKRLLVVSLCGTLWLAAGAVAQVAQEDINATEIQAMAQAKDAYRRGDYRSAIARLDQVLELAPTRADAFYLRGYSHLMLREFDASVDDFARAFEADPSFDPRTIYERPRPES